ncbi:MAG: monovalent cation/H+ antiporter complex subunit F [Syntrophobacteria bacterium]|jgi:multisubunit Na+/H+ antiporter MnhF subunit|nr:cation:proton antiporter [Deltaproteobacteria bacterium]MCK5657149.1 cation:proton antiporter [Deltaproteobacteria bacterium]
MKTLEIIFTDILYVSLLIHIVLMSVAFYRVWRGENVIDRLLGLDLLSTLTLAVLVLLSLINQRIIYLDIALGLAALGFVGMIALAKYVADEQMF